jgi:hypothetical protein
MQCPCGGNATTTTSTITSEPHAREWAHVDEQAPCPALPIQVDKTVCECCTRSMHVVRDAHGVRIYPLPPPDPARPINHIHPSHVGHDPWTQGELF